MSVSSTKKIAVVTGASRGLGLGTARALREEGFELILLGRKRDTLAGPATELGGHAVVMDLGDRDSIARAAAEVRSLAGDGINLLVNNAGVFLEKEGAGADQVDRSVQTNALGPLQFTLALGDLLRKRGGVVVNVSSGMGSLKDAGPCFAGYRISKTALNAVTRNLAQEWPELRVNSVCPGWVRTEMGGPHAERSLEQGVASILWACHVPADGPTGGFFRDGKALEW